MINVYFKIGFLFNVSSICCWYTLELPHRGNSNVHLQHYVHSINESFHHKRFFVVFFTNFSTTFLCFSVMSM